MASQSETSPLLTGVQPAAQEIHEQTTTEYTGVACCNPRRALHRYLALCFICFLSFGSYFCYDNPAALQDVLTDQLGLTTQQYSALYAWYSWPNVILSMVGGFLIDRVFGIRLGAIIFSTFCCVGQLLFAFGAFYNSIVIMYAARFVFGIGGESLAVAQNTYSTSWFRGHELNMVFGIQLSMSRIGSTVNMNVMQPIYNALHIANVPQHVGLALLLAAGTCILSLICALIMSFIDNRAKRILNEGAAQTGETIELKDIIRFPMSIWIICGICVAYYISVFPFISLGQVFFLRKFGYSPQEADAVNSLPYIVSAVASPICGLLIDKTGRNLFWVTIGTVATIACHACLAFTWFNPYAIMILFGISYSILAASLWPLVSYCLPAHQLATAYGIMQSVQNLGLACVNLATGAIVDAYGYLILEVFFMLCLFVALILCSILYFWDAAKLNGQLNMSAARRQRAIKINSSDTD